MGTTILIIDDEAIFRNSLVELLSPLADKVIVASNGMDGIEKIKKENPNVIVSDFNMPGMNGLELLKELNDKKIITPVIWLTGFADLSLFREAWRSGVYDFFEKPCDINALYECVQSAISFGTDFNSNRTPSFMNQEYFQELKVPIEKHLYKKLQEHCGKTGVAIPTFIALIEKNFPII